MFPAFMFLALILCSLAAPAALTARIQGAPPPGSIIVKPSDKKTGT